MADEGIDHRATGIKMKDIDDLTGVFGALAVSGGPKTDTELTDTVSLTDNDEAFAFACQKWKAAKLEDCPVCMVPLNRDRTLSTYLACCGNVVCQACVHYQKRSLRETNRQRAEKEQPPLPLKCPFCRSLPSKNDAESIRQFEKRVEKGDAHAMYNLAAYYKDGVAGLHKDEQKAFDLLHQSAEHGFADALSYLGQCYFFGMDGLEENSNQGLAFYRKAIMAGSVTAVLVLGDVLVQLGQTDDGIKMIRTAAAMGDDDSVKCLWKLFRNGSLSKMDLEESLRAHQAAKDEMKSEERDRYEQWKKAQKRNG